jgi:hypothetical protein
MRSNVEEDLIFGHLVRHLNGLKNGHEGVRRFAWFAHSKNSSFNTGGMGAMISLLLIQERVHFTNAAP